MKAKVSAYEHLDYQKTPITNDLVSDQLQQYKDSNTELEREIAVLRNGNTDDIKMKFIRMEQEFEDCKNENNRLKSVIEFTETVNKDLRGLKG